MNAYGNVIFLSFRPERVVIGMRMRLIGWGEGYEESPTTSRLHRAFQFSRRLSRITKRDMGNRNKTTVRVSTEINYPTIVRARICSLEGKIVKIFGFPHEP